MNGSAVIELNAEMVGRDESGETLYKCWTSGAPDGNFFCQKATYGEFLQWSNEMIDRYHGKVVDGVYCIIGFGYIGR